LTAGAVWDEDGGRDAELRSGIRIRQAGIAAGGDDDPQGGIESAELTRVQEPVEGAPSLERAGVLEQLELQQDASGPQLDAGVDDGGAAHVATDAVPGLEDVSAPDHGAQPVLGPVVRA